MSSYYTSGTRVTAFGFRIKGSKLEERERGLINLICSKSKPVALFVDDANDLHHNTLKNLKRLQELGQEANALLSIVLIGHPKLSINLDKPAMEEIGGRVVHIPMDGIRGTEGADFRDTVSAICKKVRHCLTFL